MEPEATGWAQFMSGGFCYRMQDIRPEREDAHGQHRSLSKGRKRQTGGGIAKNVNPAQHHGSCPRQLGAVFPFRAPAFDPGAVCARRSLYWLDFLRSE
jgi:hypothetical protein